MKLYTKNHLFFMAVVTALIVFFCTFVGFSVSKHLSNQDEQTIKEQAVSLAEQNDAGQVMFLEQQAVPGSSDSFVLQTAVKTDPVYTADMVSSYTQDELQNISVYEKCNQAVVNINTQVMAVNWFLELVL